LAPGDEIRIDAVPDAEERAVLDYIELAPVDVRPARNVPWNRWPP